MKHVPTAAAHASLSDSSVRLPWSGEEAHKACRGLIQRFCICADESDRLQRAFAALALFTEERGLHRSLEIAADLNAIAKVSTLEHAIELTPSPNSNVYRDYLTRLATTCTEEDESHTEQIEAAALRCA